jgi:hypothetical protein
MRYLKKLTLVACNHVNNTNDVLFLLPWASLQHQKALVKDVGISPTWEHVCPQGSLYSERACSWKVSQKCDTMTPVGTSCSRTSYKQILARRTWYMLLPGPQQSRWQSLE